MPVRIRYRIDVGVSSSTAEAKDLGNVCREVVTDALNEGGAWKTTVAAAATQAAPLPNVASAKLLLLVVTAKDPTQTLTEVGISVNGGAALMVKPVGTAKEAHFLVSASGITSLSIANTNASAVDVDVQIVVAGD